jgi:hypothetical protein
MRIPGVLSLIVLISSAGPAETTTVSAQAPTQPGQVVPGQPATPQRMPARPLRPGETPPKGSGVIKGQVIASGSGTPVRRAQVRVMTMDGRGGGGVTSTDNNGNYEVRELPAGRYNVSASKGGFVNGQFGQRRPGDPGTPIDLGEGQTAEKVNFILSRGGVISGRIVDDAGEAVSGIQVIATRFQFMAGTRRLVPGGSEGSTDRTDDQGGFRLYGLPPGEYFVSANNRNTGVSMMPGMSNTETDGFAPTYFPGTPNLGDATRIPLKAGQEMSGANFALVVARMARIRGRVLNSRGEPVGRSALMLTSSDRMGMFQNAMSSMIGPDGTFEFLNVAPGSYHLQVRPMGMPGETAEFAALPITVGNDDIDNLMITTAAGATARGVVMTDDGSAPTFRHDVVQIFAQPIEFDRAMIGGAPARINEDYTFELTSLFDRRLVRGSVGIMGPAGQSLGWYLKAVLYDGQDITDTGIEFSPGRVYEGLQLIFTRKTTNLSGLVTDDRSRPIVDATVIVFPANRERWTFQSRFMRTARPDTNGRYAFYNLPPADDYLVIAVQNLEPGQFSDPEFLERARDEAKPLTLGEGETKSVDVRLSALVP